MSPPVGSNFQQMGRRLGSIKAGWLPCIVPFVDVYFPGLEICPFCFVVMFFEDEDDDQTFSDAAVQAVANSLLCPICKEYYNCCMMLPGCNHSFCSLCVRRGLEYHPHCPVCKQPAEAQQLIANRFHRCVA